MRQIGRFLIALGVGTVSDCVVVRRGRDSAYRRGESLEPAPGSRRRTCQGMVGLRVIGIARPRFPEPGHSPVNRHLQRTDADICGVSGHNYLEYTSRFLSPVEL
jgi:hypothetical protein